MNKRIREVFENGKAFIPFIIGGDPDLETIERLIVEMPASGADRIEIGVPFSNPIAEGEVIQAASQRALEGGTTADRLFEMVQRVRRTVKIPLLFMGYANSVYGYSSERFFENCHASGVDGLILPDIPCAVGFGVATPEQAREMADFADGVIVGSAIVKIVEEKGRDSLLAVGQYVKQMKQAIS